ncbi:MAG: cell division protein FtsW [Flavobacteriaceae bacterium]|nr:MAG: cell division protein FtsW [Flavobacteriaceae bacterium]
MERLNNILLGDKYLWAFILLLTAFSFLPVYSASSNLELIVGEGSTISHLGKHAFFLLVGLAIIVGLQHVDYKYFGGLALLGMPIVVVLLGLTLVQGTTIEGANAARWLKIPGIPFTIQTSSLASLTLMIYCARYLTKIREQNIRFIDTILPLLLPIIVVVGLIFPANGSTALIIFAMALVILFLGDYPLKYLFGLLFSGILFASLFIYVAKTKPDLIGSNRVDTWISRIESFLGDDKEEESYQVKNAKTAIVQGSILGVGSGKSALKQTLPQSSSDFIFAIIVEEYGFVGGLFLIFIFLSILFRIILISVKIHTYFGTLLVFAAGLPIIFQALINMAVAVNLMPVTGQPLPMISYGGTSIWITCMGLGVILSVSRQIKTPEEIQAERKKQSEAIIEDIA